MGSYLPKDRRRIVRAVRRLEARPANKIGPPEGPRQVGPACMWVKLTASLAAASSSAFASATAVMMIVKADGTRIAHPNTKTLTVFNVSTTGTFASGLELGVSYRSGQWLVDLVVC